MTNNTKIHSLRFITVEGGEGAGKTTLIEHLERNLIANGMTVVKTREPGGTPLGEQIRSWLLAHNDKVQIKARAELLLFLAARSQHIDDVIKPALDAGHVVICDRFNDSSVAYQGAGRQLGVDWVRTLCDIACGSVVPDLTFYLDVDPLIGLQRTRRTPKENSGVGEVDRIEAEKRDFHERVRLAFIAFVKNEPQRFCYIDANKTQNSVIEEALQVLNKQLARDHV